jgi:peptidoglycan/LPS O-acetylase OafA/YrhL
MRDTFEVRAPRADIWQLIAGKLVEIQQLDASRFVFVVAGGYLLLMSIALPFIHLGDDPRYRFLLLVLIGILGCAQIVLGALLWIVAVRRRQYSVLRTASHVTLGIAIAIILGFLLKMTMDSLGTNGRLMRALVVNPIPRRIRADRDRSRVD